MKTKNSPSTEMRTNSGIGSTSSQIISKQILGILSMENQGTVQEHQNIIFSLLKLLQTEIERKREAIGYDYVDYEARLYQGDHIFEKTFQETVLIDPKIKEIYEQILGKMGSERSRIAVHQRLIKEYFADLIYESMDMKQLKGPKSMDLKGPEWLEASPSKKNIYIQMLQTSSSIYLNTIQVLDRANLEMVFPHFGNIKLIHLGYELQEIEADNLRYIFEHLGNAKEIFHLCDCVRETDETTLKNIAPGLRSIKKVKLSNLNFDTMSLSQLQILFGALKSVESIDFSSSFIGGLNQEKLSVIFGTVKNLKDLNLSDNSLELLDPTSLKIIFTSLGSLRNLTLNKNGLGKMPKESLEIMLGPLTQLKTLNGYDSNVGPLWQWKIKRHFPHLKNTRFVVKTPGYISYN